MGYPKGLNGIGYPPVSLAFRWSFRPPDLVVGLPGRQRAADRLPSLAGRTNRGWLRAPGSSSEAKA